ncbi:MAG TPA: pyridoxamine 5'-phosphate oxidase family protein [Telmatospirillum sp.]|nr:pyridoxamine 5'-phosphate oxidase family protein [Telmatospirillum sp.]
MVSEGISNPPIPPPADPDSAARLALVVRMLLRQADRAALGTILADRGTPYVSLVGVATDVDGTPILLLSRLAEHTRSILKDSHVSLLIDGAAGFVNPQQGPRITLQGRVEAGQGDRLGRRFLARHPAAALYAGFADFSFYRLLVERIHWVGGFGRAQWLTPQPACGEAVAQKFDAAVSEISATIARDHADGLARIVGRRLKTRGKNWYLASIDPDGCDILSGRKVSHRLSFDRLVSSPDEVMEALFGAVRNI